MPYVHSIETRIGGRRTSARFYMERTRGGRKHLLPIPRVHQLDDHSCGFLAALVTVQYFDPMVSVREVLEAMPNKALPSPVRWCSEHKLQCALSRFGIDAPCIYNLRWRKLMQLTTEGHPVIVTILPEDWTCDHWTVIRRITSRHVWLSNYDEVKDGRLAWDEFRDMWWPYGTRGGLVCNRK